MKDEVFPQLEHRPGAALYRCVRNRGKDLPDADDPPSTPVEFAREGVRE